MSIVSDEVYVSLICNGEFDAIPGIPIGELFESFFDNINYNVLKQNSETFVDFTGEAICNNQPCIVLIRFKVDEMVEEFEIIGVKVDDTVLNEDETLDLLEDIAFANGTIIEEEYYDECEHDCQHCNFGDDNSSIKDDDMENFNENEENKKDDSPHENDDEKK